MRFGVRISQPRSGTTEAGPAFTTEVGPLAVLSPTHRPRHMQNEFQVELASLVRRLRKEAADLKSISDSTADAPDSFERLAVQLKDLAEQVESLVMGRVRPVRH